MAAIICLAGVIVSAFRIRKSGDGKTGAAANISLRRSKVAAVILLIASAVFIVLAFFTNCSKPAEEQQTPEEPTTEIINQQSATPAASNVQTSTVTVEEVNPGTPTYTYSLTFDGNHAEVTDMPSAITVASEETTKTIQIPDVEQGTPYLANSAFIGWIETPAYSAGQKIYYPGDEVQLSSSSPSKTLYAY